MAISTFENVKSFNLRWGKSPAKVGSEEYWTALKNQAERIKEELDETIKAIEERNLNEVLDGGCDMDVTVSGFNVLAGQDYQGAIEAVCGENHMKYTEDFNFAEESVDALLDKEPESNFAIVGVAENGKTYYSVHRVADDKVCKLIGHPKIDLSEFIVTE